MSATSPSSSLGTPDDQRKLGNADVGSEVKIVMEPIEFPGRRQFAEPPEHAVLESADLRVTSPMATSEGEKSSGW